MNTVTILLLIACAVMSVITFCLYGADKRRAKKNKWRIRESTLLLCALLMGAPGALIGMKVFRHKTQHLKFRILVPLFCVVNICVIAAAWYFI